MPIDLQGGEAPTTERADKLFVLAHGYSGVGKTAFGLSFPPDFWLVNCDRAIGSLTKLLPKTTKIVYEPIQQDVDRPSPVTAQGYVAKADKMVALAIAGAKAAVVAGERPGTFMLDGADLFWEYVKIAKVPDYLNGVDAPKEYAPANSYMDNMLLRLGMSPLNVLFTTFSGRVWTGMKTESDRVKATGFKHMERWLTHEVYLFSPEDRTQPNEVPKGGDPSKPGETGQSHRGLITRSKLNEKLINRLVPNLSYGLLYKLTLGVAYPEPAKLWSPASAAAKTEEVS